MSGPSPREVADLLADRPGWDADEATKAAWMARKAALLARIAESRSVVPQGDSGLRSAHSADPPGSSSTPVDERGWRHCATRQGGRVAQEPARAELAMPMSLEDRDAVRAQARELAEATRAAQQDAWEREQQAQSLMDSGIRSVFVGDDTVLHLLPRGDR